MAEFYIFSRNTLILINMFSAICVLMQTLELSLSFRRIPFKANLLSDLLEAGILTDMILRTMMVAAVQYNSENGFMSFGEYELPRIIVFSAITIIAMMLMITKDNPSALAPALCACALMPPFENLPGEAYSTFFICGVMFYFFRSIYLYIIRKREISASLSSDSIKEAIDMLDTGLLYYNSFGRTLLINPAMEEISSEIFEKDISEGSTFRRRLEEGRVFHGCKCEKAENSINVHTPSGKVFGFTDYTLPGTGRSSFLICASDVTNLWDALSKLYAQNEILAEKARQLKNTMNNLDAISKAEELLEGKRRIHDSLGQNISLLLWFLREGKEPDRELLLSFTEGIPEALLKDEEVRPEKKMNLLEESFDKMGVKVNILGKLPDRGDLAEDFVDISKECATNAVRHGFASVVNIRFFGNNDFYRMSVTDNGSSTSGPIRVGGGINGIRQRIEKFGGEVIIRTVPRFSVQIYVPKGDENL